MLNKGKKTNKQMMNNSTPEKSEYVMNFLVMPLNIFWEQK